VPEVGQAGITHLKNRDPPITTKQQLMGHFMTLNCDKERFAELLVAAGLQPHRAVKCAEAFAAKAAEFCQQPGHEFVDLFGAHTKKGAGEVTLAQLTFSTNMLRTDPLKPGMVPGIGEAGIDKLRTGGYKGSAITTACQLMGYFIRLGRDQDEFFKLVLEPAGVRMQDLKKQKTLESFEQKAAMFCTGVGKKATASGGGTGMKTVGEEGEGPIKHDTRGGRKL